MQIAPEKQMYNLSFDDLLEHYRKLIGWDKYNSNQEVGVGPNDPDYINGIIISDIHAPFHDEHAFTKMIEQNKGKVDVCILAGDGPDFHAASRFPKFGEYFNVQQEHKAFMVILAMLSEAFPEVIMTPGNHDARTRKMYAGFLGPQWYQVLIDVHQQPDLFDLAEVMARQFKNIVIPKSPTYDWAVYRHIYQYHDIVIGHPEVYSKVANVAVGKFIDVMKKQAEPMGLIKPFSVAVMGHTHQAGKCFHDFGIIGIENASLCMTPDYAGSAKMTGAPRPPVHGYTRFKINRRTGKTDKNDINLIYI
jgi:predicted phosphodiesterase